MDARVRDPTAMELTEGAHVDRPSRVTNASATRAFSGLVRLDVTIGSPFLPPSHLSWSGGASRFP